MPTKKELAARYNITLNTVRDTLKACGLHTARSEYSEEEIRDRFDVARRMLSEEQKSYTEVATHFGVYKEQENTAYTLPGPDMPSFDETIDDPLHDAIRENVQGYLQELTDEAMDAAIVQLPQMLFSAAQKVVKRGAVDEVFRQMMERRQRAAGTNLSWGTRTVDVPVSGLPFVDESDDDDIEIVRDE